MPQLVKGGKHVFGWVKVCGNGEIPIPSDAFIEYSLDAGGLGILLSGSRTSGGFGLSMWERFQRSKLSTLLNSCPDFFCFTSPEGIAVECGTKTLCWVKLGDGNFCVPAPTLERFGIALGDRLLVVRGSGLALGFIVRGPVTEAAKNHPDLPVFA